MGKRKEPPCPNAAAHTPCPTGYLAHGEWAEQMMKTHHQVKCEGCGLYAIWVQAAATQEGDDA